MNRVYSIWSFPNITELIACYTPEDYGNTNWSSVLENMQPELSVLSPPFVPEEKGLTCSSFLDSTLESALPYQSRGWYFEQGCSEAFDVYNPQLLRNSTGSRRNRNGHKMMNSGNMCNINNTASIHIENFKTEEQVKAIVSRFNTEKEILAHARMIKDMGVTEEEKQRVKYMQTMLFQRLQDIIKKQKKEKRRR